MGQNKSCVTEKDIPQKWSRTTKIEKKKKDGRVLKGVKCQNKDHLQADQYFTSQRQGVLTLLGHDHWLQRK